MSLGPLPQDLHVHTTWSASDGAVVPEQTLSLIADIGHAHIFGISDHFEMIADDFDAYRASVVAEGLLVGTEIDGHDWVPAALDADCDYRIFHCYDRDQDYRALEQLLADDCPVIVAHPNALDTKLSRIPPGSLVELNNRYIWHCNWRLLWTLSRAFPLRHQLGRASAELVESNRRAPCRGLAANYRNPAVFKSSACLTRLLKVSPAPFRTVRSPWR